MKNLVIGFMLSMAVVTFMLGGCRRSYDTPEYKEIKNNETGFVVPLEGATGDQAKLKSVDLLKVSQVATKRVQIMHRWNQTGRWDCEGGWLASVKLITVDRTPVTVEWTADVNSGTSKVNQGIWVESYDSVGFSTGFNCTGFVSEDDAATYLYYYPEKSLKDVMDTEVRGAFQAITSQVALRYKMDILRGYKQEIIDSIRYGLKPPLVNPDGTAVTAQSSTQPAYKAVIAQPSTNPAIGDVCAEGVISFFKKRGITITTVGNSGGFTYENKDIQKAIDDVFIAQQKKNINAALLEAQKDANAKITSEATALATAATSKAEGEAGAIRVIAKAAAEAQSNPMFYQLKLIEVQAKQIEKWNGQFPTNYMSMGGTSGIPNMLINIASQQTK